MSFIHVPDNPSPFPPLSPLTSPLVTVSLFLISMSLVGMQTGAAIVENSMEFPQKTKNGTAF